MDAQPADRDDVGSLFAIVALRGRLQPARDFLWLTVLVVRDWLLDSFTHRPDLPLAPGAAPRLGLGLWNWIPGTLLNRKGCSAAGIAIDLRRTASKPGGGSLALWSPLVLIAVIWASGPFSPSRPSSQAIGVVGLVSWLRPLWAHWADGQPWVPTRPSPEGR